MRCRAILGLAVVAGVLTKASDGRNQSSETKVQLSGKAASDYLTQSSDGRSLQEAVTAARFGLRWQKHAPGDNTSGGYLGMSHNQNLNVWFGEEGVTVRPTLPEEKRDQAWSTALRLKACGYGKQLPDVPPITSRRVKDNRIEYERRRSEAGDQKSAVREPQLTEWYENRAEGIEQGFTLNERPERGDGVRATEPLRVSLSMTGDLHARARNEGTVELLDAGGKGTLSYSKLVAKDADGKELAARMEASPDGREIMLVVEDSGARYPIVIDPIVASLERTLDGETDRQSGAEFGDAVAIDGDLAVVGAWREDLGSFVDAGAVYTFSRSGTTWSSKNKHFGGLNPNGQCGASVAINGNRIAYGCPKANNIGRAFVCDISTLKTVELSPPSNSLDTGDQYGTSVAIWGNNVVVGAPFYHRQGAGGLVRYFGFNSNLDLAANWGLTGAASEQFGTSVAIDGSTLIVGDPVSASGKGKAVVIRFLEEGYPPANLLASDGATGDLFGQNVAISGSTAVVGAGFNDEKGKDAGAAYVFVRDANGQWSQQQKLTASDGRAGDLFGYGDSAVAIEGNTIVVGALFQDNSGSNFNQDGGAAYIFTRNLTTWTQQTRIGPNALFGAPGDLFGDSVSLSGDTVVVGAQHARANAGTGNTGAAYVYRLDCVPPYRATVVFDESLRNSEIACPGTHVDFFGLRTQGRGTQRDSVQWRKNGINIPGATETNYAIDHVTASDAGSYDFMVSNSCGGEMSAPATLSICAATGLVGNVSTRLPVGTGDEALIEGFIVQGPAGATKKIIVRAIGLSLIPFGIADALANPTLEIHDASGATVATNNDWKNTQIGGLITGDQSGEISSSGVAPSDDLESAIIANLAPGSYTAIVRGFGNTTGTGVVDAYDLSSASPARLANIATRGLIQAGDKLMIAGFIVQNAPVKAVIRAIGPSLSPFGITNALADTTLQLRDVNGTIVRENDNWKTDQKAELENTSLQPTDDLEAALVETIPPGQYTAQVRGKNDSTGIGVVQAYFLQ